MTWLTDPSKENMDYADVNCDKNQLDNLNIIDNAVRLGN